MGRLGWGLFSLALGIAVQVGGVKGEPAEGLAWGAAALGLVLLAVPTVRHLTRALSRAASHVKRRRVPTLDKQLIYLGRGIVTFMHERGAEAPGNETAARRTSHHPLWVLGEWQESRRYEQDTMSMYHERFGPKVKRLVREMLGKQIGQNEARALLGPTKGDHIEWIGRRLIELGEDVRAPKGHAI